MVDESRGIFFCGKKSVMMRKWQILEFDDKPFYAFVPENEMPFEDDLVSVDHPYQETSDYNNEIVKMESLQEEELSDFSIDEQELIDDDEYQEQEQEQADEEKPIISNGSNKENEGGDSLEIMYRVNVDGEIVTVEKLALNYSEVLPEHETEEEAVNLENESEDLYDSFSGKNGETISPGAFKCKVCSETFSSDLAFRKHVAWTHKKKICISENGSYICSVCDFRTHRKAAFATHLERKHDTWSTKRPGSLLFPCDACGFVCSSKHSLQSHFTRKHTDKFEHECNFCSKKFKVKGDLTNHVRFHHKEKPINCDVCGKLCQNSGSLYVHQKWAHYKPKYECHICHRRMVSQENLDQHLISQHDKKERIVCAECGKTFSKKDSFKRHMAVHTGSKPHSCMICSKAFARRSQLRQHLLIHTGKKPFVCDICGKSFAQKPGLICHRKIHPGNHPPLPRMPIGDLVTELTEEFGSRQENVDGQEEADDPDGQEILEGQEVFEGEETIEGQQVLEYEEILEGSEILEDHEILEGQEIFYEQDIIQDNQEFGGTEFHVDQEFLDEQELQQIAEDHEIEIGP